MSVFRILGLLQLICAVPVPASSLASNDQRSPVSSLEEVDDVALLQLQVQLANVSRVSDLPMTSWVISFPRTSSSTTQALIAEVGDAVIPGPEFTLFEPCIPGDQTPEDFTNCSDLLDQIIHCDFSKVISLHYWNVKFQEVVSCCHGPYSPEVATQHCVQATTRTYKTVAVHDLEREVFPVLHDTPKLRVVNLVRDPRGMYRSNQKFGMQLEVYFPVRGGIVNNDAHHRIGGAWPERLDRLRLTCAYTAKQANVSHPRILHVRFEDMISQPDAPRNLLQFLGFPWNLDVEEIASKHYPGLTPGATWAHINHYPGDDNDWTSGELEVLDDIECQSAFQNWGYPTHPA